MKNKTHIKRRVYGLILAGVVAAISAILINQFQFNQKFLLLSPNDPFESTQDSLAGRLPEIENLINTTMRDSCIPGLSVAIVHGNQTVYQSGFGFADLESGRKVTSNTLFQIGSNSKAFTALGILHLEKSGLLNLQDPVTKYIPWLIFNYKGREAQVTIEQFLHHTSGVSSGTIELIPELSGPQALEQTVKALSGAELKSNPGERYEYATVNYDVLGLVIEKASGCKYEDYIQNNILNSMGLTGTQMYQNNSQPEMYAKGYKLQFLAPAAYKAPIYDGNKPAGYILSNADDMAEWLKIQLGTSTASVFDTTLIEESHAPNKSVVPFGNEMYYADGWIVRDNNGPEIFHSGSNPNFSSYVALRPSEKIGVAILCNSNSENTVRLGENIINTLQKKPLESMPQDTKKLIDMVCSFISIALLFFIARAVCMFTVFIRQIRILKTGTKVFYTSKVAVLSIVMILIGAAVYLAPGLLFQSTWAYLAVWYPLTIEYMCILVYILITLSFCYMLSGCLKQPVG